MSLKGGYQIVDFSEITSERLVIKSATTIYEFPVSKGKILSGKPLLITGLKLHDSEDDFDIDIDDIYVTTWLSSEDTSIYEITHINIGYYSIQFHYNVINEKLQILTATIQGD